MAKQIVTRSVAFNILDPDQLQLFNHALKRSNFSAYIKRLIQRDMEGGNNQRMPQVPTTFEADLNIVQGFI